MAFYEHWKRSEAFMDQFHAMFGHRCDIKMWDTEEDRPLFTWEINRETTLYFDRLWASEIGIKL